MKRFNWNNKPELSYTQDLFLMGLMADLIRKVEQGELDIDKKFLEGLLRFFEVDSTYHKTITTEVETNNG